MTTPVHVSRTQIRIIYPKPEQEIYDDNTFLMGSIQGATGGARGIFDLRINNQIVPVSPHGFFAWRVHLRPGMNPVKVQVFPHGKTHPLAEELFALHRMPPYATPPALPLTVISETLQPASDVWLTAKDSLTVACLASVDAAVSVTIPGLIDTPVPLMPAEKIKKLPQVNGYLDTRERIFSQMHWTGKRTPLKGYYQAVIPLQQFAASAKKRSNLAIKLHLKHGAHTLEKTLPGKLTLISTPRPALIQQDHAVTRILPPEGNRLTPQRTGTLVWIDGLEKKWVRARLNKDEFFYLPQESITWLSTASVKPSLAILNAINVATLNASSAQVECVIKQHAQGGCPIRIESVLLPSGLSRLQVRFYQAKAQLDFVHYPAEHPLISQVHWRQVEDGTVELWIDLTRPLVGFDYKLQNGHWILTVQTLPKQIKDTRVLIDPGHGGNEYGATGLNGIYEKNLNLTVSKLLRDALKAEGFQVFMSRTTDQAVSLPARQQSAVANRAHIILSIHHNALPDDRDPLAAIGACTFYYHPFSKSLAESMLRGLTADTPQTQFHIPNYGLFDDSLFITRIYQALSTLIEVGFFTNPTEFERLIQPAFQKEAARRIAIALRDYCLAHSHR